MRFRLVLILTIAASLPARAADTASANSVLAEASGLAGTAMFLNSGAPGMVLVIVRGGQNLVLGYGETEKKATIGPRTATVFSV
jgi:serine-type D-Ala-D-Ala carboxypeptidase/endopeptidase